MPNPKSKLVWYLFGVNKGQGKLWKANYTPCDKTMQRLKENMVIVNPHKSQTIISERKNQQNNLTSIKINNINMNSENSVRVLGLEIDSKLDFDKRITQLCKKVSVS